MGLEPCRGAETSIGVAPIEELSRVRSIQIRALRLYVSSVVSPASRSFIPIESEPLQGLEEIGKSLRIESCLVRVFDPKDEGATE